MPNAVRPSPLPAYGAVRGAWQCSARLSKTVSWGTCCRQGPLGRVESRLSRNHVQADLCSGSAVGHADAGCAEQTTRSSARSGANCSTSFETLSSSSNGTARTRHTSGRICCCALRMRCFASNAGCHLAVPLLVVRTVISRISNTEVETISKGGATSGSVLRSSLPPKSRSKQPLTS